jgi:hypothetical protein
MPGKDPNGALLAADRRQVSLADYQQFVDA